MDDTTRNNGRPPNRDADYTYRPFYSDDPAARRDDGPIDVPFTVSPAPESRAETAAPTPPPAPQFVPATTGAGGWYAPPGESYPRPAADDSAGGWRRSPIFRWLSRVWPILLLGLSKIQWVLAFVFKFKAFTTFGSLLLSLWAYAVFFGWQFAIGFIALLFIHELGHAAVMRWQGIKTTPILFVPFMGAVIGMKEMPKNVFAEAQMALGGPILGSLGALGCLGLWQVTGAPIFIALAYSGLLLNLFNLLPVSPLDGGRAMAAISLWGWLIGLALLLFLFLRVHSLILGFILIVGGMEVFNRWRNRHADRAYYEATPRQRILVATVYFGLAVFLGVTMFVLQDHLHLNRPI